MNITLDYFDKFLISGDYVCVEDATPHCPIIDVLEDLEKGASWGDVKLVAMKEFISKHPNRYMVDTYYNDFFG